MQVAPAVFRLDVAGEKPRGKLLVVLEFADLARRVLARHRAHLLGTWALTAADASDFRQRIDGLIGLLFGQSGKLAETLHRIARHGEIIGGAIAPILVE